MTRDRLNELRQRVKDYGAHSYFGESANLIDMGREGGAWFDMNVREFMELLDIVQEKFDIDDQSRYGMNR